jgi:flagellar assembly protein FliH
MTSSSDRRGFLNVPAPEGSRPASAYARFIPREELGEVQTWQPGAFGAARRPLPVRTEPEGPSPEQWQARMAAARKEGYEDGYRDGMAALEGFKKSFTTQLSARIGQLIEHFDSQLSHIEAGAAEAVAQAAVLLARQVLRQELRAHPEHVAQVAREAVNAVMLSAREVVVRVHPDDLPLVAEGAAEALQARGARLRADASVQRGGCRVESDVGSIDALIDSRWKRAAATLGHEAPWLTTDAPADADDALALPPPADPGAPQ